MRGRRVRYVPPMRRWIAAIVLSVAGGGACTASAAGAAAAAGADGAAGAAAAGHPLLATVPLCPGLTIVTAVSQSMGDYESIKTIESTGPREVRLKYSADMPNTDMLNPGPAVVRMNLHRTMLAADLQSASIYQQNFVDKSAETIPETTAIGTSAAVLNALKTKGEAELSISNSYPGLELGADRSKAPNYYQYLQKGLLKRVGNGPVRVAVLVNDALVDLPAIQAQGDIVGDKSEFLFLDDARNPLTLAFRIGIDAVKPLNPDALKFCDTIRKAGSAGAAYLGGMHCNQPNGGDRDILKVVKITYRCAAPSAPTGSGAGTAGTLEQALAVDKKVDVYSIYFSFNSDEIREESEPTLKDLALVLRKHPDWKLCVNGHTDGIGGDKYNLDLSGRRAAAVKQALISRYGIAAERLTTAGIGKAQPKDTNDTLEGRAHNRRVELIRL
jgi:outer membrane protein OmpA-like peptidoglycan-associated protein